MRNAWLDFAENQSAKADHAMQNACDFLRDVVADPSILERIPDRVTILAVPKIEREPGTHYRVETARMLVTWMPWAPAEEPLPWGPCDPDEEPIAEADVISRRD